MEGYDVGQLIGRGGFASVFRAIERRTGRTVAIKVMNKSALERAGLGDRLRREVELHRELRHEHVVEFLDYFETRERDDTDGADAPGSGDLSDGGGDAGDDAGGDVGGDVHACLVLEYCGGGDLRRRCRERVRPRTRIALFNPKRARRRPASLGSSRARAFGARQRVP